MADEEIVEVVARAIAAASHPELFSGDPMREHRAASPYLVEVAKADALAHATVAATAALSTARPLIEAEAREKAAQVVDEWIDNTGELLLSCGELTNEEIRLVKAVLKQRAAAIRSGSTR